MQNKINYQSHQAHLPRSGFDMSQNFAFTAAPGMILPVYQDFLNVGETSYFGGDLFARTQPLVTAAMADVDFYLDWFFVPMTMLYTPWNQFRFQTNDALSSMFDNDNLGISLPMVHMNNSMYVSDDDADSDINYSPNNQSLDNFFESKLKSYTRLASHFNYNIFSVLQPYDGSAATAKYLTPNCFPMYALAYQCIYQDYFRNDDVEKRDVSSFNLDYITPGSSAETLPNLFTLRYRGWRNDYFTKVKPNPIMSGANILSDALDGGLHSINSSILAFKTYLMTNFSRGSFVTNGGGGFTTFEVADGSVPNSTASSLVKAYDSSSIATSTISSSTPNSIRQSFAVEKYLRVTGRASKNYDAQVLAHFGFKVPHDVKHEMTHLSEHHGILHIGEVISTSDTYNSSSSDGAALGSISGKGYVSIKGNQKKFTAPVDGVLMCVFSSVPRMRYCDTYDKQNAVAYREDFYMPEYDKLGAQPIYKMEFKPYGNLDPNSPLDDYTRVRFGWQRRYAQWKEKYDRTSVAFLGSPDPHEVNQTSAWVLQRDFDFTYGDNYFGHMSNWKVSPDSINSIMVVGYEPVPYNAGTDDAPDYTPFRINPGASFVTDPFLCDFRANVKKISTMSVSGEPDLDM